MDYLVKTVFKQVLPQFIQLDGRDLQMEAGTLKLNKGQLKKGKITDMLSAFNATLLHSQYEDISLEIPWLSLTTKPTKFSMSRLLMEIECGQMRQESVPVDNSQQKTYIQSIIRKIVLQVESTIKQLEIIIRLPENTLALRLSNMVVKNSNPYFQEQSVRKTIFIDKLQLQLSNCFILEIYDVSICVNLEQATNKLIIVVDRLNLKILPGIFDKLPKLKKAQKKQSKSQHIFLQIRHISLWMQQLSLNIDGIEIDHTTSATSSDTTLRMGTLTMKHLEDTLMTLTKTDKKQQFQRYVQYEQNRQMARMRKQNNKNTIEVSNVQVLVHLPKLKQLKKISRIRQPASQNGETSQQYNLIVYHNRYTMMGSDGDAVSLLLSLHLAHNKMDIMQFQVRMGEHKMVDVSGMKMHRSKDQIVIHVEYVSVRIPMVLRKMMVEMREVVGHMVQPTDGVELASVTPPTVYVVVDYMQLSVGNILQGFIALVRCQIQDVHLKMSDKLHKMTLKWTIYIVDQYTLVEEPLSNTIDVAMKTQNNGEIMVDISNIKCRLSIQQLMQLTRMACIGIVNYCENDIVVVQDQYRVVVGNSKRQCIWLVRNKMRIHYKGLISQEIECDFEDGVDKVVKFGKFILIMKLMKGDIVIKSSNYARNCIHDMRIVNGVKSMEIPMVKYQKITTQGALWKMNDFDRFARYFSDTHIENLRMHWMGRQHVLELMMQKQQIYYYAVRDVELKQYCGYVWTCNVYSVDTYTIMPFLVVQNNTMVDLNITIVEKKTGQKYERVIKAGESHVPQCHGLFDYYLKQFVVQVETEGNAKFESEQYYFSTLGYVDEPIERVIPLRNTTARHYDKMYMCIKETVKVRTRFLSFSSSLKIVNLSRHGFDMQFQQRNEKTQPLRVDGNKESLVCLWIKDGDSLTIWLSQSSEAKINLSLTGIVNVKQLLSFNFCKLKDLYRNVLVTLELTRDQSGHETIVIEDYVTLCNLCRHDIFIDGQVVKPDETRCLNLAPSLNNEMNNKVHRMDQINAPHVYNQLFSEEDSCVIGVDGADDKITFNMFVSKTVFESMHQKNKKVYRLLKEIRRKLAFYMIEDVCCPNNRYTIISNDTKEYFLISQDVRLQSIFEGVPIQPSLKSIIEPNTVNIMLKKTDLNIFLCNQHGQKLSELKTALLDKAGIEAQKNTFNNVTLIQYTNKSTSQNFSIRLKGLEVSIANGDEDVVRFQMVNMNFRRLEKDKYDILVSSISLSQVQTNRPILSFPEESYVIVEFRLLSNLIVIKNMFAKLKSMVLDMRKDTLLNVIKLMRRMGVASKTEETTREQTLFELVKSPVILVKNMIIDEFDINLSISMESIELQNKLPMLTFKINNEAFRRGKITNQLYKFYSSAVISKFPKLSFIFQNIKHPLSSLKSIFNFRDTLAQKHVQRVGCSINKIAIPSVDFLNIDRKGMIKNNEQIVACLNGPTKIILTEWNMIITKKEEWTLIDLKKIESVREERKRGELYVEIAMRDKSEVIEVCMGNRKRTALMSLINRLIL